MIPHAKASSSSNSAAKRYSPAITFLEYTLWYSPGCLGPSRTDHRNEGERNTRRHKKPGIGYSLWSTFGCLSRDFRRWKASSRADEVFRGNSGNRWGVNGAERARNLKEPRSRHATEGPPHPAARARGIPSEHRSLSFEAYGPLQVTITSVTALPNLSGPGAYTVADYLSARFPFYWRGTPARYPPYSQIARISSGYRAGMERCDMKTRT